MKINKSKIIIGILLAAFLLLAGCGRSLKPASKEVKASAGLSDKKVAKLQFGPVYPAKTAADPIVKKTLREAETTGTIVSAEIRGYLVDWVIHETSTASHIIEFPVMKDGSVYQTISMRPSAAFGKKAPARLKPESAVEAGARKAALAAAQKVVAKAYPEYASVDPVVYNYLIRINRRAAPPIDVWVDPDAGNGRFFYGIKLHKADFLAQP